jgi:hypothetical protein
MISNVLIVLNYSRFLVPHDEREHSLDKVIFFFSIVFSFIFGNNANLRLL